MENSNLYLGYLTLYGTETKENFMGSILVTDQKGFPQEFRCTQPVKPSKIQKPLYGDMLEPYIGVHLCGLPLINSIKNKIAMLFINMEYLLEVRESVSYPVFYIYRAGEASAISNLKHERENRRTRIENLSGKFKPIIAESNSEFEDDLIAKTELKNLFVYFDPLEPFDRIQTAIRVLKEQDKKFQ